MEQNLNYPGSDNDPKPDRSLMYMAIVLGFIVLVMGYLTLYVDDASSMFNAKEENKTPTQFDSSNVLIENSSMSEDEVKSSLIKFIEAFYRDQKNGYFDPPSYFSPITKTFYNFHNLTYQRVKEVYLKRMSDRLDFKLDWSVSSLEFNRSFNELTALYWANVTYFQPSQNVDVTANIRYEMIINAEGKISSLREIEINNLVELPRAYQSDTSGFGDNAHTQEQKTNPKEAAVILETSKSEAFDDSKLYDFGNVEIVPEYRGGQKALAMFLASRLRYPAKARENKIQGKVYVAFVIEKNGSLGDFKIIRGLGHGCDEEAVRVLKLSPNWKPAYLNDVPVRTSYTLPINFQLSN
jgi:TonB family protein